MSMGNLVYDMEIVWYNIGYFKKVLFNIVLA